jgi:hypothetical protein
MSQPFRYSNKLHRRTADPGPFSNYRAYKKYLRREFRQKCVYCRMPDTMLGKSCFGVDHYLPKSDFPGLKKAWENLFYACHSCNTFKGKFSPEPDLFIPNPCKHRVAQYMQFNGPDIETFDPVGDFTVRLLALADTEIRKYRDYMLRSIKKLKRERVRLREDLAYPEKWSRTQIARMRKDFQDLEDDLRRLTGT